MQEMPRQCDFPHGLSNASKPKGIRLYQNLYLLGLFTVTQIPLRPRVTKPHILIY